MKRAVKVKFHSNKLQQNLKQSFQYPQRVRYQKAKIKLAKGRKRVSNICYNYSKNLAIVEDLNIGAMTKTAKGTLENPAQNLKAK